MRLCLYKSKCSAFIQRTLSRSYVRKIHIVGRSRNGFMNFYKMKKKSYFFYPFINKASNFRFNESRNKSYTIRNSYLEPDFGLCGELPSKVDFLYGTALVIYTLRSWLPFLALTSQIICSGWRLSD